MVELSELDLDDLYGVALALEAFLDEPLGMDRDLGQEVKIDTPVPNLQTTSCLQTAEMKLLMLLKLVIFNSRPFLAGRPESGDC